MLGPCGTLMLRLTQFVFSGITLAVSLALLLGQRHGDVPMITKFSVFLGGFGLFMAFFGVVSQIFVALRNSKIVAGFDWLTALVQFAGGVAMAAALGPGVNSCSNKLFRETNEVINTGFVIVGGQKYVNRFVNFEARCQMAYAATAFQFLTGMTFVVSGLFLFLASQRKRSAQGGEAKW